MAKSKLVTANKRIEKEVTEGFEKISRAVVGGYTKIEERFLEQFLTNKGESVCDAKARLTEEKNSRKGKAI